MAQIHEQLAKIMAEVPAIAKSQKNEQQGFTYRGIDQVYNALQPLFGKHGVFLIPEVLESKTTERQTARGGTLYHVTIKMSIHLVATDGSEMTLTVYGEGMDSGDKAYNKAMSVALKYGMFQVFLIPTASVDPDGESHEVAPETPEKAKDAGPTEEQQKRLQQILVAAKAEGLLSSEQRDDAMTAAGKKRTSATYEKFIDAIQTRLEKIREELGAKNDAPAEEFEDDIF